MRRGFTLIELVIVIALITLVGLLVVVNAQGILRGLGDEPVDRILQKAVREARFQAASLKEPVSLYFFKDSASLLIEKEDGTPLANFRLVPSGEAESLELQFEQVLPVSGLSSFSVEETVPANRVVFRPDRSSTPFRVNIQLGKTVFSQRYDPFSSIVIDDSRQP